MVVANVDADRSKNKRARNGVSFFFLLDVRNKLQKVRGKGEKSKKILCIKMIDFYSFFSSGVGWYFCIQGSWFQIIQFGPPAFSKRPNVQSELESVGL